MTARWFATALIGLIGGLAVPADRASADDVKPTKMDTSAYRDKLIVLEDQTGARYVVLPPTRTNGETSRGLVWVAAPKSNEFYRQYSDNHSWDGKWWSIGMWTPRLADNRVGSLNFRDDQYFAFCSDRVPLTQLTGDKAKAILDKSTLMTPYATRQAYRLARDDSGVYYYIEKFWPEYGKSGYRVWVGKKGAMKQVPLVDVAVDTVGEVFSTQSGNLRLTATNDEQGTRMVWIRGTKREPLIEVNTYTNARMIYNDLGIYTFLGTLCDKIE